MYRFLRIGLFVLLGASVSLMLLCRAVPQDWETALKIRCTEIEIQGSDADQVTTLTQAGTTGTTAAFVVEGDFELAPAGMGADFTLTSASDSYNNTITSNDVSGDGNWQLVFGPAAGGTCYLRRTSGAGYTSVWTFNQSDGAGTFASDVSVVGDLLLGATPVTITEASGYISIVGHLTATAGTITGGLSDTNNGYLRLYGDDGSNGGYARFYTGASYDTTTDYYRFGIRGSTDSFQLGPPTDLDAFKMENDGTIDLTAALKLAGTAMTASAPELNYNDTAVAGTAVAGKTLVLGADKNIDTLDITKDGLEIGGSAVTITAAEANLLDGESFVNCTPIVFRADNVQANQSQASMYHSDAAGGVTNLITPWAGSVVGISLTSTASVSTGTITVWPGAQSQAIDAACLARVEAGDGSTTYTTFTKDAYATIAGMNLTLLYDTSADFAPTTSEIAVTVWLEY